MPSIKNIPGLYRLFFYSFDCGEPKDDHVQWDKLICKFWLVPIFLCKNGGFTPKELNIIRKLIETHLPKILKAWHEHCGNRIGTAITKCSNYRG